jgi:methylated-DNA-[protein]-cysteine S-methyltransferase
MSNRHLPPLAAQARLSTPLGPVTAAATHTGLAGLWFDGQAHHPGALDAPIDATHPHIARAQARLERYWRGDAVRFDDVPLDLHGTPFQRAVWQALRQIARGGTCSYSDIAAAIGAPAAVRAAGAAIGRNPVSVIVPCHRVLGRNGALTGYAGGLERKQSLLQLEQKPACR